LEAGVKATWTILALVSGASLACASGPFEPAGSCDLREIGDQEGQSVCWEVGESGVDRAREICSSLGQEWSSAPCDRTASVGGCEQGGLTRYWYYSLEPVLVTTEEVRSDKCRGAKFVDPLGP